MNRREKGSRQIALGVILLLIAGGLYFWGGRGSVPSIANFAECAAAGFPIMESYPRQCRTPAGQTFREDIGNELEKDNLIRVANPRPNAPVSSPLTVTGMARGNWFFEASFPVRLLNSAGEQIAGGIAQAQGEWMTTEFVPFTAVLTFTAPTRGGVGTLVLEKDNPSGLPKNADELRIPVRFEATRVNPPVAKACLATGCSRQICSDEEVITTCEFRAEYACYKTARCERQSTGACGWTDTLELRACVAEAK